MIVQLTCSAAVGLDKKAQQQVAYEHAAVGQRLYILESMCTYLELRPYIFESLLFPDHRLYMFESGGMAKLWRNATQTFDFGKANVFTCFEVFVLVFAFVLSRRGRACKPKSQQETIFLI